MSDRRRNEDLYTDRVGPVRAQRRRNDRIEAYTHPPRPANLIATTRPPSTSFLPSLERHYDPAPNFPGSSNDVRDESEFESLLRRELRRGLHSPRSANQESPYRSDSFADSRRIPSNDPYAQGHDPHRENQYSPQSSFASDPYSGQGYSDWPSRQQITDYAELYHQRHENIEDTLRQAIRDDGDLPKRKRQTQSQRTRQDIFNIDEELRKRHWRDEKLRKDTERESERRIREERKACRSNAPHAGRQ